MSATVHVQPTVDPRLRVAQAILLAPLGALLVVASLAFTVVSPPEPLAAGDWIVATWAIGMGVCGVALGARLGSGDPRLIRAARALALAHVAFGVVKLTVYDESAPFVFFAIDLVLLAALWPSRHGRVAAGRR